MSNLVPKQHRLAGRVALLVLGGAAAAALWAQQPASQPGDEVIRLRDAQQQVFRAALRAVAPCIVRIDTIGGAMPVEEMGAPGEEPVAAPTFRQADGPTTGVIAAADGYILTSSFNFVRDPAVITISLADGRRFVGRLIARDRPAGLTLLKIDARNLPVPHWLPRESLRPGQWALVAGYGHGTATPALSVGVVSALDRLDGRAVQTDAKTSPANYGGPVFDIEGRVMGICVPKAGGEDEIAGVEWYDSGIGFAIHADYVRERLPRLQAGQELERGLAGLRFESAEPVVGVPDPAVPEDGVRIVAVAPGPAADAGLRPDDVITHLNGRPVARLRALRRELVRAAPGDTVQIGFRRAGEQAAVAVTLVRVEELQARAGTTTQPASQPATPTGGPP